MPEEKFAPPPSNIVIRTMEKDIQALQQGGGELPSPPLPEEPAPPPAEEGFLQQNMPPAPVALQPPTVPPPPPITPPEVIQPAPAAPEPPAGKKSGPPKQLLLALGGIGGLLILGALGYFVVFPIIQNAFAPVPLPLPPIASPAAEEPTPSPEASPSPTSPAPAISLVAPADEVIELNLPTPTANALLAELQDIASASASAGTFKEIRVASGARWLSASEIFALLFVNPPMAITSALTNSYTLFLYWVSSDIAHLGAYFALSPVASEAAAAAAAEWEANLSVDADAFFLGTEPGAMTVNFRDGTYQNIPLRFAVFGSGMAIDYAIAANTFVYTTHRDSMYEALRRLTGVE